MKKPKTTPVSVRLEDDIIQKLKERARLLALIEDNDTTYSDIIRMAVDDYVNNRPLVVKPKTDNIDRNSNDILQRIDKLMKEFGHSVPWVIG